MYLCKASASSISRIVPEVCSALCEGLKDNIKGVCESLGNLGTGDTTDQNVRIDLSIAQRLIVCESKANSFRDICLSNFQQRLSKFGWCKERGIISDRSLDAVREIVASLRSNVHILGHGWLFRAGAAVHHGVVEEILRAIEKGHSNHIRGMLQAGWRLEASQALYIFLTRLQQPLIPHSIQSLVLDDNGNVPPEIIATDVLGLLKQELSENHLALTSLLLNLLDNVIKVSPADELRGNTLPTSMLPLFFNVQNRHISEWRRIATIFVEVIRHASQALDPCFACDQNNVPMSNDVNSSELIEGFNQLISEPVDLFGNAATRRYLAPAGFRGDCYHMEVYHRNNHRQ